MTLAEYQTIIGMTAIYPKEIGLAYCALGLTGEAGEVAEKVKKIYRDQGGHVVQENRDQIKKEIGDVIWYCTAIANELQLTLEEILEANFNKLTKRRETNTLHGSGDDREESKT
jgi:NTP pyrophosphatase (non-canonical NTP hydrolase)